MQRYNIFHSYFFCLYVYFLSLIKKYFRNFAFRLITRHQEFLIIQDANRADANAAVDKL